MQVFRWHEWMSDLAMDASKPFERQALKVVPDRILYTETWLWKLGFGAKQKWLQSGWADARRIYCSAAQNARISGLRSFFSRVNSPTS